MALVELKAGLGEVEVAVWAAVFVTFQLAVTRRAILEDVAFDLLVAVPGDDHAEHEHANEDEHQKACPTEKPAERALLVRDGIVLHRRTCIGACEDRRNVHVIGDQPHGGLPGLGLEGAGDGGALTTGLDDHRDGFEHIPSTVVTGVVHRAGFDGGDADGHRVHLPRREGCRCRRLIGVDQFEGGRVPFQPERCLNLNGHRDTAVVRIVIP